MVLLGLQTSFRFCSGILLGSSLVVYKSWTLLRIEKRCKKTFLSGECCKFLEKSDQKKNRIKVPKTTLPLVSISFQLASNKYTCYIISQAKMSSNPSTPFCSINWPPILGVGASDSKHLLVSLKLVPGLASRRMWWLSMWGTIETARANSSARK